MTDTSRGGTHETPKRGDEHGGKPEHFNDHSGTARTRDTHVDIGGGGKKDRDVTKTTYRRWHEKLLRSNTAQSTIEKYTKEVQGLLESCKNKPANKITVDDVQRYLDNKPGRPSQETAFHAIKGFLAEAGRAIDKKAIRFKPEKELRIIEPLTTDEVDRMIRAANNPRDRLYLSMQDDAGGRVTGVLTAELDDIKYDPEPYLMLKGDVAKNHITSEIPLSKRTAQLLREYLDWAKPKKYIFERKGKPGVPLNRTRMWEALQRIKRRACIEKPVYNHLFRHMKALRLRESNADTDVVLNMMGWKDTKFYDTRYGRRSHATTRKIARELLNKQEEQRSDTSTETIIKHLLEEVHAGRLDEDAYKLTLAGLLKKDKDKDKDGAKTPEQTNDYIR